MNIIALIHTCQIFLSTQSLKNSTKLQPQILQQKNSNKGFIPTNQIHKLSIKSIIKFHLYNKTQKTITIPIQV